MNKEIKKKQIVILGSTGSIGTQALQVVEEHPELYEVYALTANNKVDLLIAQARKFQPEAVVIANEEKYGRLKEALSDLPIKVYAGAEAVCQIVESGPVDIVLTAMVGYAGLKPTINAIRARKAIALANKETLVCAGELVMSEADRCGAEIVPVDSEHSAIFQCLTGREGELHKILLTGSGGPFRGWTREQTRDVTPEMAVRHPNWSMGAKISVDSATMMNKGLEFIEAMHLFGVTPDDIQVLIHPESVVHSMVELLDGTVIAQLGVPDMRVPIRLALTYPNRAENPAEPLDLLRCGPLTFDAPDEEAFPCFRLAKQAAQTGGTACAVLNGANETAVAHYLRGECGFYDIPRMVDHALQTVPFAVADTLETVLQADRAARAAADSWMR